MRGFKILPALALGLTVAACGGDATEDAAEMGGGDAMEMAASDGLSCYLASGTMAEAAERPSPLSSTEFMVGGSDAMLCYGAPSARGRDIMGGLLVYGQPERIGANEATALHLAGPASVGGVTLDAGSYSMYAVPGADEWQFFLNSNWERWGIPIDDGVRASDVGSFSAAPEAMDEYVETLQYRYEGGEILLEWENTRLRIPVS